MDMYEQQIYLSLVFGVGLPEIKAMAKNDCCCGSPEAFKLRKKNDICHEENTT